MTDTAGRRVHVPISLRWGDLDAYNHVNNAAMLKLLEEARIRALWAPEDGGEAPDTAVIHQGENGVVTLVARQEIEYFAPVPYTSRPLDVQMWFSRLGGSSMELCYEVFSPAGVGPQTLHAHATAVLVRAKLAENVPVRLTPTERAAWTPYLGDEIRFRRR